MEKLPKYIERKINRIDALSDEMKSLHYEVDQWLRSKGVDIYDSDFVEDCKDIFTQETSYYKEPLLKYINGEVNNDEE